MTARASSSSRRLPGAWSPRDTGSTPLNSGAIDEDDNEDNNDNDNDNEDNDNEDDNDNDNALVLIRSGICAAWSKSSPR